MSVNSSSVPVADRPIANLRDSGRPTMASQSSIAILPPSSGGIGRMFITPSDSESSATMNA